MEFDVKRPMKLRNGMPVKDIRLSPSGKSLIGQFRNKYLGNLWFSHYWTTSGKSHYDRGFDLIYDEVLDGY